MTENPLLAGLNVVSIRSARALTFFALSSAWLAFPATWLGCPGTLFAQVFPTMQRSQPASFIEAPRRIQQQLREAQRALDEERFGDAVVRLGDLLAVDQKDEDEADLAGQDFFLEFEDSESSLVPVRSSLLKAARDLIGSLSSDALETYELRYGPLARKLLSEAAEARDWHKVRDVRRKYFHTQAGFEASMLLAQHEVYQGHPLAASILLDDIVELPRAIEHLGKGVVLLHASATKLAGREVKVPSVGGGGEVIVGGQAESYPAANELSGWIAEHVGLLDRYTSPAPVDYPVFGGSANRNGTSAGQMPLTNLRWKLNTAASPRQERGVRKAAEELTTGGKLPPPSWTPLRIGDQLLMRTTERLVGVDYRTGKRVWTYPWQSASETFDQDESSLDAISGDYGASDLLSQRVWNDLPYGQVTSDGQRVFMLDDLREVEVATYSGMINMRGTRPADKRTNTLVALDLSTEGKLQWLLGAGGDKDSSLSDAFFLGPPLPLDGRLYVMVEISGDINLCCLDPASGREIWRQQLVAIESGSIDSDPIRRVAGAVPSFHEGLLICPTGAGATVAIDLADRMLRWGVSYDRDMDMFRNVFARGRGLEPSKLMQRWYSGAAVASDSAVIVTPIESNQLFGFDLLTGESLFDEIEREQLRYVAGIRDGRFFVVGANRIQAFSLEDGKEVWSTQNDLVSAGQQICGYGMFGKDEYMVPTSSNQIIRVSLADGKVIQRRNTRFPLGNLVAVGGEIITQSPTALAVAFGEATLEPIVNRMLKDNPNDFEALVRKSELLIQRDQREEALDLLSRARAMEPDNDEVRMLSVTAMLGSLRETLSADSALIETLNRLIDRPSQRVELLSLRIRTALSGSKHEDAARHLIDLSRLIVSETLVDGATGNVVDDSSRHCSIDAWLAARFQEIASDASESELENINRMVREECESQLQGSTNLLKQIAKHFVSVEAIEPVRRELTQRMKAEVAHFDLERLALGTQIPSRRGLEGLSNERLTMLASAYSMGGLSKDARMVLDVLETRDLDDQTVLDPLRQRADAQVASPQWPDKVTLEWHSRPTRIRPFAITRRVSETTVLAGKSFEGWRLVSEGRSPLAMRDPLGMLRSIQAEGFSQQSVVDKEAQICGGVMVVVMPNGLIGIDLYQLLSGNGDSVRWRRGLSGDSGPVAKRSSVMTPFDHRVIRYNMIGNTASRVIPEFRLGPVMGDRVLLLQGGDLLAIDLMSGETIWRNSSAPKSGAVLCDGERVAVVSAETNEVVFFHVLDGRKLESKPWDNGTIWESIGTNVLSYKSTGEKRRFEVRLTNAFTGEVLLRHDTSSENRSSANVDSTYGQILDGRYMTLLENSGQALIWDVMEGLEIGRPMLPEYSDLQGINAMYLDGQIILLPKRRVEPALQQNQQLQTEQGTTHPRVHGVHAVSLADGSLRWSQVFERPWGCTLTQPAATPILVLTRSPFKHLVGSRRKSLDALALDVRDGDILSERLGKEIMPNNNQLETRLTLQPGPSKVLAQIGPELLTYTFGDVGDDELEDSPDNE